MNEYEVALRAGESISERSSVWRWRLAGRSDGWDVGLPVDTVGSDGDGEGAFRTFFEVWALRGLFFAGAIGVSDLHRTAAKNLEVVVEVCAWGEALSSEAGAWIRYFDQADGLAGAVADGGFNVGGVTTGDRKQDCGDGEYSGETHEFESIR